MIAIDGKTIGELFHEAVSRYPDNLLLLIPSDETRAYYPQGYQLTYQEAQTAVSHYRTALTMAGYGHGHRIALLLENRPEFLLLKLACSELGISCVPVNPDYRAGEIAYLLHDSNADLAIVTASHRARFDQGAQESGRQLPTLTFETYDGTFPPATTPPPDQNKIHPNTEASLMYTSGTTGNPKGCRMGHAYELQIGAWYASRGGVATFSEGTERVYNPLPLFHVNAGIMSFFGVMTTGNCQIQPERFSRTRWWPDVRHTKATIIHYLGVVVPVLMNEPAGPTNDQQHHVKFGFGAGVEPTLHRPFEDRFGFPLVELWGMTEMCRILTDNHEPRQTDSRAIGRPQPGLEVRVVDAQDHDVPLGQPGEMVVRHSVETPRQGAFLGYLNKPDATAHAWRNGWFHTGDTVTQDDTGMIYFVDRKKNIIRRSGENIAAAEVEACIQEHPAVAQVTVLSVTDDIRDEEVYACIVLSDSHRANPTTAQAIFDFCFARLAYYKAPGWLLFVQSLPVTGTQKVLKHKLFAEGEDPRQQPDVYDFRPLKKRSR